MSSSSGVASVRDGGMGFGSSESEQSEQVTFDSEANRGEDAITRTPESCPDAYYGSYAPAAQHQQHPNHQAVFYPRHRPPHQQPVLGYGGLPILQPNFDFPDFRRPRPPRHELREPHVPRSSTSAPPPARPLAAPLDVRTPPPPPQISDSHAGDGPSLESKDEFPDLAVSLAGLKKTKATAAYAAANFKRPSVNSPS